MFIAGQGPTENGEIKFRGQVGKDLSEEEGYKAARLCALNCLACVTTVVKSLDEVIGIVNAHVFVNCSQDFTNQPEVANGASDVLVEIFGEEGCPTRSAIGTWCLPRNIPVEVEMVVTVKE